MSENDFKLWSEGLKKAEYNMLRMKSMRNEMILQDDENGNITRVPARDIFMKLYHKPAPTY